jgi:hypothetical protein
VRVVEECTVLVERELEDAGLARWDEVLHARSVGLPTGPPAPGRSRG